MNCVLSSYLIRLPHFQYRTQWPPDDPAKVKTWVESSMKCGLPGVVFHDCLSPPFVQHWSRPRTQFLKTEWRTPWNATEERFVMYYDWLRQHPEVDYALTTDLGDVEFYRDPFALMIPFTIYLGSEQCTVGTSPRHVVEAWMRSGFGEVTDAEKVLLNPGVLGGHRTTLLVFLEKLIAEMKRGRPGSIGLDLVSVNRLIYREAVPYMTGFPLHTLFLNKEPASCGAYVRHK